MRFFPFRHVEKIPSPRWRKGFTAVEGWRHRGDGSFCGFMNREKSLYTKNKSLCFVIVFVHARVPLPYNCSKSSLTL